MLHTGGDEQQIQHISPAESNEQSRSIMVAIAGQEVTVKPYRTNSPVCDNRVRRIQQGLGSSTGWPNSNRRCLVSGGGEPPHQLSGIAGSVSSPPSLREELDGYNSPLPFRQCNCSNLYQSEGRYHLCPAVPVSNNCVDLVRFQEHHTHCRTPPGSPQHDSRSRITDTSGSLRLDAEPECISENKGGDGAPGGGLICFETNQATTPILQLESRSRSSSDGCLHAGLVTTPGLCQSTLVLDPSVPLQGENAIGASSVNNSLVENPVVVSNSAGAPGGLSSNSTDPSGSGSDASWSGVYNETGGAPTDRLAYLRQSYSSRGFSSEASNLMVASWRDKTNSNYSSSFAKWAGWCHKRGRNPLSGPIADVVNFLADLSTQGYQYQSLNCYRSAISSVHEAVDGVSVGTHPAVARLLKGAFHIKPPMPRYSSFWDVGTVTSYLQSLGDNESLSLRHLTLKTAMLLALTRPSRSADLSKLDVCWRSYQSDGVTFRPVHLAKQNRLSKHIPDFFFPCFKDDPILCPVVTLRAYEERTKDFREFQSPKPKTHLFLSWIGEHNPVTSSSIARWLKQTMKDAGIDVGIFKSHSVRGAACSKAAGVGVTTKQILEAADWSSEGTFQKFYHRNLDGDDKTKFGTSVLSSQGASNHTC